MATRRRAILAAGLLTLLAGLLGAGLVHPGPAAAADDDLSVTIQGLTPSSLGDRGTLRLEGEVTNEGSSTWTDVQAYLVIRPEPLTSRAELADAVEADRGFAGPRIVDVGRFDELGSIGPDSSRPFVIEIPVGDLPISGANGVYPVGVQILATDPGGERSNDAVTRATTFLPHVVDDESSVPTTVVWPLLMPSARQPDGRLADPAGLLASMGPDGRLRRMLDAARAFDPTARGVIVDPALVDAAADLADGVASAEEISENDQAVAADFLADLVELAQDPSTWVLDYDRTDVLALAAEASNRRRLFGAVERATDSTVAEHSLSRARVAWPTRDSVTEPLTRALRERGEDPAIIRSTQLVGWVPADGVLLERPTSRGNLPLLVDDDLTRGVPGPTTTTTLRQRVLAGSALAALGGGEDAASLVIVDPRFVPDPMEPLMASASYVEPRALSDVPLRGRYDGRLPATTDTDTLSSEQMAAADDAADVGDLLSSVATASTAVDDEQARALANVLGVRWRSDRDAGILAARTVERRISKDLASVEVEAPPSVTLSSSSGAFPLTISNGSDEDVSVGVRLESSNPALTLDDQPVVEIDAGERQTVTVDVDLEEQNATTVTARLTSPDGRTFGSSEEFIVKSSRVGAVLWVTMAAAGLFVLFALVRRFRHRRVGAASAPFGDDDE